jgi:amphi-Trp domain-containing protein
MGDELMKIERKESVDRIVLTDLLLQLARDVLSGTIVIEGECVDIPDILDIEFEYKCKEDYSEIELEIKWC